MFIFLATASDFFTKIAESLQGWLDNIPDWNWTGIWEWAKGIATTVGWGGVLAILIKFVIPFVKDSAKPILTELAKQAEVIGTLELTIKALEEKDRTIGAVLTEWISLQATTNLTSKTLTDEQKAAFLDIAEKMKALNVEAFTQAADKIETIVEDGVVTAEETVELLESTKLGQAVLGTSLDSIVPKG